MRKRSSRRFFSRETKKLIERMADSLKINKVRKIILFGGGDLLVDFARIGLRMGKDVFCFAVKRHLSEKLTRNNKLTLAQALKKEKVPFCEKQNINGCRELKMMASDGSIGIGLGEAYTFSSNTIRLFKGMLFDFMVIDLPRYRGGAHFTWQILRSDNKGCWNIQMINKDMIPGVYDSGKVLMKRIYRITEKASSPQAYFDASFENGRMIFVDFLRKIDRGQNFKLFGINEKESQYFPRLSTPKHGFIDWSWQCREINSFIAAFGEPYCGASTFINNTRVYLKECSFQLSEGEFHPFMSGLIFRIYRGTAFVAARGGTLKVKYVADQSGRQIITDLKAGQRFYTPQKYLERAMQFCSDYNAGGLIAGNRRWRNV